LGQLNLEILEPDFDKKSTSSYELSILVGVGSLIYLVLNDNNQILLLRDYGLGIVKKVADKEAEIIEILNTDPILPLLFRKVKIAFQNAPFSIVPSRLYQEEQKSTYLKALVGGNGLDNIHSDELPEINAHIVYNLNSNIHVAFKNIKPVAKYYHAGSAIILGGLKLTNSQKDYSVNVNIRDNHIQISLFEKKNLLLFNQNAFFSAKDAVYYLLLLFSQFKLNNEETPVWLSGQIMEDSELYTLFYRYIKNIRLISSPDFLQYGKKVFPAPPHFYYDLLSLSLCK
jgi:hypothetical protein